MHFLTISSERAAVMPLVLLLVPVLIMFVAISFNTSYSHMIKEEMQIAADSAALAGAKSFANGEDDPWPNAKAAAIQALNRMEIHGNYWQSNRINLDPNAATVDSATGALQWQQGNLTIIMERGAIESENDGDPETFRSKEDVPARSPAAYSAFAPGDARGVTSNAVRITVRKSSLSLMLSLGNGGSYSTEVSAVARSGPPGIPSTAPFAIPLGAIVKASLDNPSDGVLASNIAAADRLFTNNFATTAYGTTTGCTSSANPNPNCYCTGTNCACAAPAAFCGCNGPDCTCNGSECLTVTRIPEYTWEPSSCSGVCGPFSGNCNWANAAYGSASLGGKAQDHIGYIGRTGTPIANEAEFVQALSSPTYAPLRGIFYLAPSNVLSASSTNTTVWNLITNAANGGVADDSHPTYESALVGIAKKKIIWNTSPLRCDKNVVAPTIETPGLCNSMRYGFNQFCSTYQYKNGSNATTPVWRVKVPVVSDSSVPWSSSAGPGGTLRVYGYVTLDLYDTDIGQNSPSYPTTTVFGTCPANNINFDWGYKSTPAGANQCNTIRARIVSGLKTIGNGGSGLGLEPPRLVEVS